MLDEKNKENLRQLAQWMLLKWSPEELAAARAGLKFNQDYSRYKSDPYKYAKEVLKIRLLSKQIEIADALLIYPRVMVRACHKYSSTHTAGALINWFFDSYVPSVILTVSPITDVLWKEIRLQRRSRFGLSPKAPRMEITPEHYAQGYTIKDDLSFSGHSGKNMLVVFDNAQTVPEEFWQSAKSMLTGESHRWLALVNPTDTGCFAYSEEMNADSGWHVMSLDARDHPNIALESAGHPPQIEAGLRLSWFLQTVRDWTTEIDSKNNVKPERDFEWPPNSGKWHRPGPEFESKVLGRWPSAKDSYFLTPTSLGENTEGFDADFAAGIEQTLSKVRNIVES